MLFFALAFCAYTDISERKIKNYIVFPLIISGIIYNSFWGQGIFFALLGMTISFPLLFMAFGMGDVKLLMGIGAIYGLIFSLDVLFFTILSLIIIGIIFFPKKALMNIRNIYATLENLIYFREFPKPLQKEGTTAPFAPFVLCGYILAIIARGDFVWSIIR